jgi:hypothetical protein
LIFNRLGGDVNADGLPSMWQALGKYGKSKAQFKTPVIKTQIKNGLWGDFLPILNFVLPTTERDCDRVPTASCRSGCRVPTTSTRPPCNPPGYTCHSHKDLCCWPCLNGTAPPVGTATHTGRVEMTVVPLADPHGNRFQRGYYRLLDYAANGTLREARYFDTFAYTGNSVARGRTNGIGSGPGSRVAIGFYSEVLAQQSWWALELEKEGVLSLELPIDPMTNGLTLANQAKHSLIRNMITRDDFVWPVYGVSYNYMHSSAMGFQDTFVYDLDLSLEWGAFTWAKGILTNWLQHFAYDDGTIQYRGLEMSMQGRTLTLISKYYAYTRDSATIETYFDEKIVPIVTMLRMRRIAAKKLPNISASYGMPTGNELGDLWGGAVECGTTFPDGSGGAGAGCVTEMPYLSIATEMVRGFEDLGKMLLLATFSHRVALGKALITEAAELKKDLLQALARSTIPAQTPRNREETECVPTIFGMPGCDYAHDMPKSYMYPTLDVFTTKGHSEAFHSAVLPNGTMHAIIDRCMAGTKSKTALSGSVACRLGMFSPCTFANQGWTWGLLQIDRIDLFLLNFFAVSAHSQSRGFWTAAECRNFNPSGASSGHAAPAQALMPLALRWMLVWTDPAADVLWLAKAVPRVWLAPNKTIAIGNAPTAFGRLSLSMNTAANGRLMRINVSLPFNWSWPTGGIKLRVRVPQPSAVHSVSIGGKALAFDRAEETMTLLTIAGASPSSDELQRILVTLRPDTSMKHDDEVAMVTTTTTTTINTEETNCRATLQQLCQSARAASAGDCFVCCGQHQHQLQRAGCVAADFEPFCHGPPTQWPYSCDANANATQIAAREPRGLMSSQVVLITGADGHMGVEIVRAVALAGATPLLSCRTTVKCTAALEKMKRELPPATFARLAMTPPIGAGFSCDRVWWVVAVALFPIQCPTTVRLTQSAYGCGWR